MKVLETITPVLVGDPIELPKVGFRRYDENPFEEDPIQARVKNHYYLQHRFQTVDFVKSRVGFCVCLKEKFL